MTLAHLRHVLVSTALVLLALSVTGCAGGAAWGATFAALLSLSMLFAAGCNQSHSTGGDGGTIADGGPSTDAGSLGDAGGAWERCCVEGRIDSCFCPGGHACNYGWFTDCGGGTCSFTPDGCGDAGTPDGTWEPCCNEGVIDVCFCPADTECNYGWYTDCGGGTCSYEGGGCADGGVATDAGTPDGSWEPCCTDGVIGSCFCPAGVACNYGWFTDCGGGTCVGPVETCPAP